jgi:pyruvate formate lyase activating enzyme
MISLLPSEVIVNRRAIKLDYKVLDKQTTSTEILERADRIGRSNGLEYIYMGNIVTKGVTCCPGCGAILIERSIYSIVKDRLVDG